MPDYWDRLSPDSRRGQLGLTKITGNFPSTTSFGGPGVICEYDLIVINRVALPLAESPEGGTALDADKQKSPGSDFARVVGRGYDVVPVRFVLLLWRDLLTGMDWLGKYDQFVCDQLMPTRPDARNAVEIYHPAYSRDGISSVVIEKRPVLKHVGKQFFQVAVEGWDLRRVKFGKAGKSVSKTMKNDTALKSDGSAIGGSKTGPAHQATGRP